MGTQADAAVEVQGVVECMVRCIEQVQLTSPTATDVAATLQAVCVAVAMASTTIPLLSVYAMAASLMHNTPSPSLPSDSPQPYAHAAPGGSASHVSRDFELQEMHRLAQSCVQDTHKHRVTRASNYIHEQRKQLYPHTDLPQVVEDPLEERWTHKGEPVYARKNVFHETFAPLSDCRRYAKHRPPDAAIYKALRTIVRRNLVAREVDRIARLNQPKPETHPDFEDGGEGAVDDYDYEGTTAAFNYPGHEPQDLGYV